MVRVDRAPPWTAARLGQDAEPREGILVLLDRELAGRDCAPAHPVEPVAACDHVAVEPVLLALVHEVDARLFGLERLRTDVLDLEEQRPARVQPGADQVLHNLLLSVDHDAAAFGEVARAECGALARRSGVRARGEPSPRAACDRRRPTRPAVSAVPCSSTPARTRFSTYSRLRASSTTARSRAGSGGARAAGPPARLPRSPPESA